jgi:SPP1 family phage portal protein
MDRINTLLKIGSDAKMTDFEFIENEIAKWKVSRTRRRMIEGERYYNGEHDILFRKRTAIGRDGELTEIKNLPNNKIIDNQYMKMVEQKVNYLLGRPLTFDVKNEEYETELENILGSAFHKTLKILLENALNCGVAWLYMYYDNGELKFKCLKPFEVLPFWKDAEHTELENIVRLYEVEEYEGRQIKIIEKAEVYYSDRVECFVLEGGKLKRDANQTSNNYITTQDENGQTQGVAWGRIPIIPFKANTKEIPLITRTKSIQDTINATMSDFANNMQEDARNTILVLKNYDGTYLTEFRHNLTAYGVVKVRSVEGAQGGVDTLKVDVNADNYNALLETLKKAMIENAMGFDAKNDKLSGSPNQLNIRSMYSDMDLSADAIEIEFQSALQALISLINIHLANTAKGDFTKETVEIIFNRDVLINESESIDNCRASVGILSNKTIISQHPWIKDIAKEEKRIAEEQQSETDDYNAVFGAENEK